MSQINFAQLNLPTPHFNPYTPHENFNVYYLQFNFDFVVRADDFRLSNDGEVLGNRLDDELPSQTLLLTNREHLVGQSLLVNSILPLPKGSTDVPEPSLFILLTLASFMITKRIRR